LNVELNFDSEAVREIPLKVSLDFELIFSHFFAGPTTQSESLETVSK
jgi:hypothetical protein